MALFGNKYVYLLFSQMSLEFDWLPLSEVISGKIRELIESVPKDVNPMLEGPIILRKLSLGDRPPQVALSHIIALHLDHQAIGAVFRYDGNAELEVIVDLNLNVLGATKTDTEVNRFMGNIYCDAPMKTKCRFLISQIRVTVKIEISHGAVSYFRFEEPPEVSFCIDSNLSLLGPVFESGLQRVMRLMKHEFSRLPEKIELDIPLPIQP